MIKFNVIILIQIRREYGCYDEVSYSSYNPNKRQCNWIRFLRIVQSYCEQVNLIGTKVKGQLIQILILFIHFICALHHVCMYNLVIIQCR